MVQDSHGGGPQRQPAEPPQRAARRVPLAVSGPLKVWIVSPQLVTVCVHFDGVRTQPCRRIQWAEDCPGCDAAQPVREQHWLTVQHQAVDRRPVLVCLTNHALASCPKLVELSNQLWGHLLKLYRTNGSLRGPMWAQLLPSEDAPALWAAPATWDVLRAMWEAPLSGQRGTQLRAYQPPPPPPDEPDPAPPGSDEP